MRAARAAVFAALCVTLSSATHILISGAPIPLPMVAAVTLGVFAVTFALGARERGYVAITAALIPQELAADALFNAGQNTCYGPGGGPVTGSWHSLVCHGEDGGVLGGHARAATAAVSGGGLSVSPWLLLLAHVVVGLVAGLLLRRGEHWLHRGARTVFRPLLVSLAALAAAPAVRRPAPRRSAPPAAARALPLLLHTLVRRGPPVPAAA